MALACHSCDCCSYSQVARRIPTHSHRRPHSHGGMRLRETKHEAPLEMERLREALHIDVCDRRIYIQKKGHTYAHNASLPLTLTPQRTPPSPFFLPLTLSLTPTLPLHFCLFFPQCAWFKSCISGLPHRSTKPFLSCILEKPHKRGLHAIQDRRGHTGRVSSLFF